MKRNYLKRLICLGVAALVLCSALAVAAVTGSPYETLKSAIFKGMRIENGTVTSYMNASIEGFEEEDLSERSVRQIGDKASLTRSDNGLTYSCEDFTLRDWGGYRSDESWYYAVGSDSYSPDSFGYGSPTEQMTAAQQRFVELLADLFVGDLKNNISMYERDGIRYISGTLTSPQIPEIVNAGFDVLTSEFSADADDYEVSGIPPAPKKLRLTYVHGAAQVDADGNLIALSGEATLEYTDIHDVVRLITVDAGVEVTDIGTTNPECPIDGVGELLNDYNSDSYRYPQIRFELNEDGSINRDTVVDMMG